MTKKDAIRIQEILAQPNLTFTQYMNAVAVEFRVNSTTAAEMINQARRKAARKSEDSV